VFPELGLSRDFSPSLSVSPEFTGYRGPLKLLSIRLVRIIRSADEGVFQKIFDGDERSRIKVRENRQ